MKRNNHGALAFSLVFLLLLSGCGGGKEPPPDLTASYSPVSPREAEALYRQAEDAYHAGKVPHAINLWENIIQQFPSTAMAAKSLNRVGEIYLAQGQLEQAARYFDYLVYAYPAWEGITYAKLNQLRVLAQTGKKKQVMKEAVGLWDAAANNPEVRFGLAELMIGVYGSENDIETAFDWCTSGFSVANTPEQKKSLTKQTRETLAGTDEGLLKKLYKKNPTDFMKVFLDFRSAEIEIAKGQGEQAREQLRAILAQNRDHPLAAEIQAAIRGTKVAGAALPLILTKSGSWSL